MFNINNYEFDKEHNYLDIGGEAMIFHCHHYITNLQRTILDADYIDSRLFLIGSAVDAVFHQLSNLCDGLNLEESKEMACDIYKTFGYGIINLDSMNENGCEIETTKSFFSKTWEMKFGKSDKPVDYYTTGFLIATYAVIYKKDLKKIFGEQTRCMACGDKQNKHIVKLGKCNFATYEKKSKTVFKDVKKVSIGWEHEETITKAFSGAASTLIGDKDGSINAFGVYLVRNQSDICKQTSI